MTWNERIYSIQKEIKRGYQILNNSPVQSFIIKVTEELTDSKNNTSSMFDTPKCVTQNGMERINKINDWRTKKGMEQK